MKVELITKKIADLREELSKQNFTEEDNLEIEKLVEEYRQELIDEKQREYDYNVEIINGQIEILEQVEKEAIESEKQEQESAKVEEETTTNETTPITPKPITF